MKKITAIALAAVLGAWSLPKPAHAIEDGPETVGVTLAISEQFNIVVPVSSIDFGANSVATETAPQTVGPIQVFANRSQAWYVKLSADPLTHSDGTTTIPNETDGAAITSGFRYFHTFDNPDGNEIPATGSALFVPTSPSVVFEAGPAIHNANPTEFGLGFLAVIKGTQKAGTYTTTLNLLLTETL
ncbi:MAG: hypothetical protein ACT4O3_01935 [Elusimicrobiota bacterium]